MGSETIGFAAGDRVRHGVKPEWGVGVVVSTQLMSDNGQRVQRLVVDFGNHGRVTLNTGVAQITREGDNSAAVNAGWLGLHDRNGTDMTELSALPEEVTDPFAAPGRRLRVTLDLYRFTGTARGLTDWAVAATGLSDPLTRYARTDLETQFKSFMRSREEHLRELLWEAKRGKLNDVIEQARQHPLTEAREAVERMLRTM